MTGEITLSTELGNYDMVAGDYTTFVFNCVDQNGAALSLLSTTCTMKVYPYGQPTITTLTKTGVIIAPATNGVFEIRLTYADTKDLYGVYECAPQVVDSDGKFFRPGLIILTIKATPN